MKCCNKPKLKFITGGSGISIGAENHRTRESVHICLNCGEFRVFSEVNGESQVVTFQIWNQDIIEAALIPINRIYESQLETPLSLTQRKPKV